MRFSGTARGDEEHWQAQQGSPRTEVVGKANHMDRGW